MKVAPVADRQAPVIFRALRDACIEWLVEVLNANTARTFSLLEARLLDSTQTCQWIWKVSSSAGITSERGPGNPVDEDAAISAGALVELFFAPTDVLNALNVPAARPKVYAAAGAKQSLIIIGDEVPGSSDRIPIDDSAESLKRFLASEYPYDPEPEVVVVQSPIDLLKALGVIGDRPRDFRYVFTMSHAYKEGLLLFAREGLSVADAGWVRTHIHSQAVADQTSDLYGSRISFGEDDNHQFATHQFRVSHLRNLPRDMARRLRANLENSDGAFLVGCNTNPPIGDGAMTITEEFARRANITTWGAAVTAKFKHRAPDGTWVDHDELRGIGIVGQFTVLLLPEESVFPLDAESTGLADLVAIYRQALTKAEPGVH